MKKKYDENYNFSIKKSIIPKSKRFKQSKYHYDNQSIKEEENTIQDDEEGFSTPARVLKNITNIPNERTNIFNIKYISPPKEDKPTPMRPTKTTNVITVYGKEGRRKLVIDPFDIAKKSTKTNCITSLADLKEEFMQLKAKSRYSFTGNGIKNTPVKKHYKQILNKNSSLLIEEEDLGSKEAREARLRSLRMRRKP